MVGFCKDCSKYDANHFECYDIVDLDDNVFGDPPPDKMSFAADVSDDSGLMVSVKVGPMFGCVRFTP